MRALSGQQEGRGCRAALAWLATLMALAACGCISLVKEPDLPSASSTNTTAVVPGTVGAAGVVSREDYRIRDGDVIHLQVSREDDLSGDFTVLPGGVIAHPLLGRMAVGGLTVVETEHLLTGALKKDYLVNPRVLVQVRSSVARRVVVLGEVKQPGVYELAMGERFTLLQVVAKAGGFTG